MYSKLGVLSLLLIATGSSSAGSLNDGDFLKIVSVSSGNVLTVSGSDATEGRQAILSPWSGQSSQKWLAVEAVVAGDSFLLMPQRQRYPWQRFIRNGGTAPYRDRHNDLPDWTMVLQGNTNNGQVTQEARDSQLYQQWRGVQVDTPTGKKYLIKNRKNDKCLQAPGSGTPSSTLTTTTASPPTTPTTQRSFFRSLWSSVRSIFGSDSSNDSSSSRSTRSSQTSANNGGSNVSGSGSSSTGNVILANCDSSDTRQHWALETLAYEY